MRSALPLPLLTSLSFGGSEARKVLSKLSELILTWTIMHCAWIKCSEARDDAPREGFQRVYEDRVK